jgi:plasmid stabilization system protein ParE
MRTLAWDDRAIDDLIAIADYIAKDSPRAALRVATYIKDAARSLETFPNLALLPPNPERANSFLRATHTF